jgi:putative pyruvate formate lyase activating enzyme
MYAQTGHLDTDINGFAISGMLIRHLVMPGDFSDSDKVLEFIADKISPDTFINIMPQYRPEGRARLIPEIAGGLDYADYERARNRAVELGFKNFL